MKGITGEAEGGLAILAVVIAPMATLSTIFIGRHSNNALASSTPLTVSDNSAIK